MWLSLLLAMSRIRQTRERAMDFGPDDAVIGLAEYLIGDMQFRGRSKERLQDE